MWRCSGCYLITRSSQNGQVESAHCIGEIRPTSNFDSYSTKALSGRHHQHCKPLSSYFVRSALVVALISAVRLAPFCHRGTLWVAITSAIDSLPNLYQQGTFSGCHHYHHIPGSSPFCFRGTFGSPAPPSSTLRPISLGKVRFLAVSLKNHLPGLSRFCFRGTFGPRAQASTTLRPTSLDKAHLLTVTMNAIYLTCSRSVFGAPSRSPTSTSSTPKREVLQDQGQCMCFHGSNLF